MLRVLLQPAKQVATRPLAGSDGDYDERVNLLSVLLPEEVEVAELALILAMVLAPLPGLKLGAECGRICRESIFRLLSA